MFTPIYPIKDKKYVHIYIYINTQIGKCATKKLVLYFQYIQLVKLLDFCVQFKIRNQWKNTITFDLKHKINF